MVSRLVASVLAPQPARASSPAWTSAPRSPRRRSSRCPAVSWSPAASHRTTIDTDVLDGWDACLAALVAVEPARRGRRGAGLLARPAAGCGSRSSATRSWSPPRPAAGSRCPAAAGWCTSPAAAWPRDGLRDAAGEPSPTCVLLVGGTDGGNAEVLLALRGGAGRAAVGRPGRGRRQRRRPGRGGRPPRGGGDAVRAGRQRGARGSACSRPDSARAAIREMFLRHVIGGKHLSRARRTSPRWSAAPPRTSCSPPSSCSPTASTRSGPAPVTWSSSTSAAPPPTCTRWSRSTPRTPGCRRRWWPPCR